MFLLMVLVSVTLYPTNSVEIGPPSDMNEDQIPADISEEYTTKTTEQPIAIEGRFIIAEGNSDHLFRPYDFVKEDTIQLGEGDTQDIKNDDEIRHRHDTINPSLPHIQIIEGHFIYYNNDSDEHLFAKEDFEKHDAIPKI